MKGIDNQSVPFQLSCDPAAFGIVFIVLAYWFHALVILALLFLGIAGIDDLLETIRGWGIREVKFMRNRDAPFIPPALKLPFMVVSMGLIIGEK